MKVLQEGDSPITVPDLNLLELACSDCARRIRKDDSHVFRVLHRYSIDGVLVESVIVMDDETSTIKGGF